MCVTAARRHSHRYAARVDELVASRQSAHDRTERLKIEIQFGQECFLREHCIVLTQVYAGFRPQPELSWLGLPEIIVQTGGESVNARLSQFRNNEFTERIAAALPGISHLYANGPPGQNEIEESVASGGLVIVEDRGEVYWEAEKLPISPRQSRVAWRLLCQLARKALSRSAIRQGDVYGDVRSDSTLAMAVHRLQEILPPKLAGLIVPGNRKQTHRLDLPSRSIHIFNGGRRTR